MESRAPRFDRDPMSSIGIGGTGFEKTRQGVPFSVSVPRIDFLRIVRALDVPSIPSSSYAIIRETHGEKKGEEVKTWPNSSR